MSYPMNASDPTPMAPPPEAAPAMAGMSYRLSRPGMRPLSFHGTVLAMAMSFTPDLPYWYELNIYRTAEQKFVLSVKLFFGSTEETDRSKAWQFDTLTEAFDALEAYDAADDVRVEYSHLTGMAAAELAMHSYDIAARISAQRSHFGSLVDELFSELDAAGQPVG